MIEAVLPEQFSRAEIRGWFRARYPGVGRGDGVGACSGSLSAAVGLVEPEEVIAPYDMYLADRPVVCRRAWAGFVAAALERAWSPRCRR